MTEKERQQRHEAKMEKFFDMLCLLGLARKYRDENNAWTGIYEYTPLYYELYGQEKIKLSYELDMFCVCRKLLTGLHEQNCRRFRNAVEKKVIERARELCKQQK